MQVAVRALSVIVLIAMFVGSVGTSRVTAQALPAASAPAAASVSGVITDTTGAPLAGATITMMGAEVRSATTDAHGAFAFKDVKPGVYTLVARKTGYETATQTQYSVLPDTAQTGINVTLAAVTMTSLREIGRVSVNRSHSAFNTSMASLAVVSQQKFVDQGQLQLSRLMDETPGIVTGHPATTANGASPGAIVFPNIRGGLSFQTASLIDGHPLAVADYADYVTTFWNTYMFQDFEVVKGPGAMSTQNNYAINGTVNFRTLEPTRKPQASMVQGIDAYGGSFSNYRYTGSTLNGKLGWALDYAIDGTAGPLQHTTNSYILSAGTCIGGTTTTTASCAGGSIVPSGVTKAPSLPGVQNAPSQGTTSLVACCLPVNTTYTDKNELAKLRYNFSNTTSLTASYLANQAWSDQNGNHATVLGSMFNPAAGYNGSIPGGSIVPVWQSVFAPANEFEINNEPIFQGELRTSLNNDTFLARYYAASINRLQYDGGGPLTNNVPITTTMKVYGSMTPAGSSTPVIYNGQSLPITIPGGFYRNSEEDKLHGESLEWDHPAGPNLYTVSIDNVSTQDDAYSIGGTSVIPLVGATPAPMFPSAGVPWGSGQRFTTGLVRGIWNPSPKWNIAFSNYFDSYMFRWTTNYSATAPYTFNTTSYGHYDGRLGLTYRANGNTSIRASAGSSIAPPDLVQYDYSSAVPAPPQPGSSSLTQKIAASGLKPETAFGYDLGADLRLGPDKQTVLSVDGYLTNLHNQFVNATVSSGLTDPYYNSGLPLYYSTYFNLSNSRYEGLEFALSRDPQVGLGWTLQGAVEHAFPYNVPSSIYVTSPTSGLVTNLAIVPGANFYTACNTGCNAISNQSIPYSQGYAELHVRTPNGGLGLFGLTYYGPNNSFNVPAFFVGNATGTFPLFGNNRTLLTVAADNVFNALSGRWISYTGGTPIPLVNGKLGLTTANVLGPTQFHFNITRSFGPR